MINFKHLYKRWVNYEFWPYGFFYVPAYFYYFILALKARSLLYFTALNPVMRFGGTFLSSKEQLLKQLPPQYLPKSICVDLQEAPERMLHKAVSSGIELPLIIKPDNAERGKGVEKIESLKELEHYCSQSKYKKLLVQEYIDYPIELGLLFYWDLEGKPQISSLGTKAFCTVTGDGKSTFEKLIRNHPRVAHRAKFLRNKKDFSLRWDEIIPKGEEILVEPIGNQNRGTTFLDGRDKITKAMLDWTSGLLKQIQGFDYGRIDLKIKDWGAFEKKEGIKILEINGVNSEPIHIYDPNYYLFKAYKDLFFHMRIIQQLSLKKIKHNQHPSSIKEFQKGYFQYLLTK